MGASGRCLVLGICSATVASIVLISISLHGGSRPDQRGASLHGIFRWWNAPAFRPACKAIRSVSPRIRTIAVVGNGPLSDLQRAQVAASDVVLRFNKLSNRFCGERMDVWVVRFAEATPLKYHGLAEVAHCTTEEALAAARALWFLDGAGGGRARAIAAARARWPALGSKTLVALEQRPLAAQYARLVPGGPGNPSSGWSGMMLALECAPPGARVHLFGFNWSRRHWSRHRIGDEEAHARGLHAAGRVFIHDPICGGLRACGNCSVVADFDERGFVCSNATYGAGDPPWRAPGGNASDLTRTAGGPPQHAPGGNALRP